MQILEHILKIRREKAKQEFWQTVGNQLATIWHCEIGIANLALRNWHCEIRKPQCTVHLSHKNVKNLSEISHCQIRNVVCEIRNSLANFASALRNSQPCELIANFAILAKIPTVLSSNFVLRITFSSELRFGRFWYRWKA